MHKSHSSSSFWDEDEDPIRPGLNHPSLSGQLRDRETDGYASSSSTGTERQLQLRRRGPDSKGEGQHGSTSSLTALEEPPLHRLAVGQVIHSFTFLMVNSHLFEGVHWRLQQLWHA